MLNTDFKTEYIGHLLGDRTLGVPPFQRSYSWGSDEVELYWDDLRGQLDTGTSYFLGTVVLARRDAQEPGHDVIDGQQRLATTTILLSAIRDAYRELGDDDRANIVEQKYLKTSSLETAKQGPRLTLNDEDQEFFNTTIIESRLATSTIQSHQRISRAKDSLAKRIDADLRGRSDRRERLGQWVSFLASKVAVVVVDAESYGDAYVIFETLNDRGKPLTVSDLLRSHLMSVARDRQDEMQDAWQSIISHLGMAREDQVFVDFVRHHWSSIHGPVRERDLFREIRKTLPSQDLAVEYTLQLPQEANVYAALLDPDHEYWHGWEPDVRDAVAAFNRLGFAQFRPLALAVIDRFERDAATEILQALLNWMIRGVVVGGVGGGVAERTYSAAGARIRRGEIGSLDSLLVALAPIVPDDSEFENSFAGARVSRPQIARYILIALHLAQQGNVRAATSAIRQGPDFKLEHVIRGNSNPSLWTGVAKDRRQAVYRRLGNMYLKPLTSPALEFTRTSELIATPSHIIGEAYEADPGWTEEIVNDRQGALAEIAIHAWPMRPR